MKEINLNNKIVLLEALEYIDRDLIAETVEDLRAPNMRQAVPERDKSATRKSIKYTILLVACFIMLGAVIPVVNYVLNYFNLLPAGNAGAGDTSEDTYLQNTEMGIFSYPSDMPAEDIYADVKKGGWVVFNGSFVMAGDELWDEFYEKVSKGEPARVLTAKYYTLDHHNMSDELYQKEKDKYPKIFLTEIIYDGEIFTQTTRYSIEDEIDSREEYKYLIKYDGESYHPKSSIHRHVEEYMLVNQEGVTCKEVWSSGLSAQLQAHIPFYSAYSNISDLKDEYTDRIPKE